MAMRVTTNGTMYNYKSSLMRSRKALDDAATKVLTQRNFNSFAEDPASASRAFQIRRNIWRTDGQIRNSESVIHRFEAAFSATGNVVEKLGGELGIETALRGISDQIGSGRNPLGQVLLSTSDSIVQTMNSPYGDGFLFAGADGLNVPFSWGNNGELLYRGIDVNTTDPAELAKLDAMSKETTYVDLGLGLAEDADGKLVTSSVFNSAIPGVKLLGYGMDAEGLPNNLVSIMKELGDIFANSDLDSGDYASAGDAERAQKLTKKLENTLGNLRANHIEIDTRSAFLHTNQTRLESARFDMNEQLTSLEQMDPALAITAMSQAQFAYNAALKIGNDILSQSLLDYMK